MKGENFSEQPKAINDFPPTFLQASISLRMNRLFTPPLARLTAIRIIQTINRRNGKLKDSQKCDSRNCDSRIPENVATDRKSIITHLPTYSALNRRQKITKTIRLKLVSAGSFQLTMYLYCSEACLKSSTRALILET